MKNELNWPGVSATVIVRGLMTIIAAVNILAGYLGFHIIPLSEGDVSGIVDGMIVAATAAIWIWGWWKNNSFTINAQQADTILDALNDGRITNLAVESAAKKG